ncbi:hypothetical protein GUJ93_ZPchr0006g45398 [Zizania palustris]|nr:hypothetical protein GUJ93_ZPchr0006g45398 [Zizania palustris]
MSCAPQVTARRSQTITHTHNSTSSFTKGQLTHRPENRDSTFTTLPIGPESTWKLVPFLSEIQEVNKCFTPGAASTESLDLLSPQPIILYLLEQPNEKNMLDQVDYCKPISSGSPQSGSALRQHRHRRKINKSLTTFPPCHVLANNSPMPVTDPVISDYDILHDDGKPPKRSPKKKGSNRKGKHCRRATCKRLNLPLEIHCEENIDAASPVEVLLTDLLADKLSETSSSGSSLVKEANHLGKDVEKIFSSNGIPYLNDGSNSTDTSEFDGSTFTEHGCAYLGEESNNYEKSLRPCVYNSNDAATGSSFHGLESDNSVNVSVNDEARLTIKDENRHDHFQHGASTDLNNVKKALHLIGAHLSITRAEVSNDSFGNSSCCSKDVADSSSQTERCMYKNQTPFISSKHASSQSSRNYHAPKNGMSMVPKNHLQQKNGSSMMQLIYDKDSSVRTNSVSSDDTGVGSNSPTEGNGSSQSGVEKAALASRILDSCLSAQATSKEACTSTIEEDPRSSCPDSKAISTHSNSRSLCADPSTAEMEERCYVKLATENTPRECSKLYSTSGKYFKLYSASGHISVKWVPVGKKDSVHSDAPETCAVQASDLTNDIPISANIDVENVPEANNEANKLAAEISDKPKSPGELNLRWQACSETGTDFNKIRKAVCDAYSAQQRVEDVQVIIGRPLADFEQFISSASPALYCSTRPARRNLYSHEWIREGRCFHQTNDINLRRIWQWYEEPGCYGLEVKAQEHRRSKGLCDSHYQFTTYFVPYLSAVQLFGQAKRTGTGSVDKEAAGMDVTSKTSPCLSSLPILANLLPQQLHKRNSSAYLQTKDDEQFGRGELVFEFFESEQPFWRRQLFDKIKELTSGVKPSNCQISGDPMNLELNLRDLHPASWYCVAWYPIYRIPDGKLQAAFLTYHSLGHSVCVSEGAADSRVVLPVTGLQSYNDKGELWFEMGGSGGEEAASALKERVRTLNEAAWVMSTANKMRRNSHPDYDFFLSRNR